MVSWSTIQDSISLCLDLSLPACLLAAVSSVGAAASSSSSCCWRLLSLLQISSRSGGSRSELLASLLDSPDLAVSNRNL